MRNLRILIFLLLIIAGTAAKAQYLTGPNGVKYFFWRDYKRQPHANIGDLVFVHLVGRTDMDSIVMSSYIQGDAFQIFVPAPTYKGCFYEMLTMMGEGDSAEVSVIADSLFFKSLGSGMPDFITPGSKFKLTLKLESIVTKAEYDKRMAEEAKFAVQNQQADIDKYITENQLQMTKTASGIYYQFPLKGFGKRPVVGDSVMVQYTGYFLDGRIFDSNMARAPYIFKVGTKNIIQGWNEVLQLMTIHDRIIVILPYQLAYGEKGSASIPPFTPLVFEIELLDIK